MDTNEVIINTARAHQGDLGLITLNRPNVLNALSHNMIKTVSETLKEWEANEKILAVLIEGSGERAFCAGGDIRSVYETGKDNIDRAIPFFTDEYNLNSYIHNYSKPYIAILDGITMGGGCGLSIHGSHRIGTERLKFAMPETGIGFYPDIGASFFLNQCPGYIGMYLGLVGSIISAEDALFSKLIDTRIDSTKIKQFKKALTKIEINNENISLLTQEFSNNTSTHNLNLDIINACFSKDSVESILDSLQSGNEWSKQQANTLLSRSPTSLKIAHRQLTLAKNMSFEECMAMELKITMQCLHENDFYEGIRAQIIDKTKDPKWQPDSLSMVTDDILAKYF